MQERVNGRVQQYFTLTFAYVWNGINTLVIRILKLKETPGGR